MPLFLQRSLLAVLLIALCTVLVRAEPISVTAENLTSLTEIRNKKFDELYVKPGTNLSWVTKVIVDPAQVNIREDAERRYSDSQYEYLGERLTRRLEAELGDRFELVTEPGDDVLRVSAVLVEVKANKEFTAPYGPGEEPRGSVRGLVYDSVGIGSAEIEATFTIAETDELLAVIVYAREGSSFGTNLNVVTQWGDAFTSFRRFADDLTKFIASNQTPAVTN